MKFVWKGRIPHKGYAYTLYSTYMRIYLYDKYIETSSSKSRFWGGYHIYIYICECMYEQIGYITVYRDVRKDLPISVTRHTLWMLLQRLRVPEGNIRR